MENEIIYFEMNNWIRGASYPADEPFSTWMDNLKKIVFNNETWVKENKLCVVRSIIDMSLNFCITSTKEWVEENCPKLLTEYQQFLRTEEDDGITYGYFGDEFLTYSEENIGIHDGQFF